jgi:hypothetical protein
MMVQKIFWECKNASGMVANDINRYWIESVKINIGIGTSQSFTHLR